MANIFYPSNANLGKITSNNGFVGTLLNVGKSNAILFFDSQSNVKNISASLFNITASQAASASYIASLPSASYAVSSSYAATGTTSPSNVIIRGVASTNWGNNSGADVNFPSSSSVGDFAVISIGNSQPINTPSTWTASGVSNSNPGAGAVFSKILTSTDLANGSASISFTSGAAGGGACCVVFVGSTAGIREVTTYSIAGQPQPVVTYPSLNTDVVSTDSIIYFAYNNRLNAGPCFTMISRGDVIGAFYNGYGVATFERFAPDTTNTNVPIYPSVQMSSPSSGYYFSATVIKSV